MQKEIVILDSMKSIAEASSAVFRDKLSGEMTLSFQTKSERVLSLSTGARLSFDGQIYRVVSIDRSISDGRFLANISAEQISLSLADEEFDLEEFVYSGMASEALREILDGTDFMGALEPELDGAVEFDHQGTVNRRTLINELCAKVGGELSYDEEIIEVVSHRGEQPPYYITEKYPVNDFIVSDNESGISYEMVTNTADGLAVGDNVRIRLYEPFFIDVETRIIELSYNPFYRKEVVIRMGDYSPNIVDEIIDDREEAEDIRDSLGGYVTNDVLESSIGTYINSENGKASLIHSLSGTYVTTNEATKFVERTELSAEISAYIDSASGTAQITQNLTGTFVKEDALGNYVEKTELSTEIGSYIDTAAGTGKIVSAVSGTYQTISGMSEYTKTTVTSKIEQNVSSVQSAITLTSSYSNNTIGTNVYALLQLVSNANSSSIKIKADKIDFTGFTTFLRASDLGASGSTTIDGGRITTGTISADRIDVDKLAVTTIYGKGTYATKPIIGTNVTTTNLQVYVGMEDIWTTPTASLIELGVKSTGNVYIGTFALTSTNSSYVDFNASSKAITSIGNWALGTTSSPWDKIIVGTVSYYLTIDENGIIPNTSSTSYFNIGSSTAPVNNLYCKKLYVDGSEFAVADINTLYASSTRYLKLDSSYNLVANYSGFSLGSTSYPFDELYIGSSTYYWKFTNLSILPGVKSTAYFDIGSSTYPIYRLYTQKIFINGIELSFGAGVELKMGGSTSYYITANTSRELRPSSSSTTYPFYLGSSSYYWHYAYIGSTASYIGSSASSKLGFFGTTPVARQTVSSSATVATLITALKAYGLIY